MIADAPNDFKAVRRPRGAKNTRIPFAAVVKTPRLLYNLSNGQQCAARKYYLSGDNEYVEL